MCRLSLPVFVTVTVRVADDVDTGWFPNAREPGATLIVFVVPRPVSATAWPATVSVPFCAPGAFGEKTTWMVQVSPPARLFEPPRPPHPEML